MFYSLLPHLVQKLALILFLFPQLVQKLEDGATELVSSCPEKMAMTKPVATT